MSVQHDLSGRRSVQLELEVPGTPEEVWRAIATGPGISSWFAPSRVEEREGGTVAFQLGPGMDSAGTVTAWQPPVLFAYEERDWMPKAPPLASEWTIEARAGGKCVIRLVHSLFASGDDWDNQLESFETGWQGFFRILRLYMTHFRGERCSSFRVMGEAHSSESETWQNVTGLLGLAGVGKGQPFAVGPSRSTPLHQGEGSWQAPPLAGSIEPTDSAHPHEVLLRLETPASGLASLGAYTWSGKVLVSFSFYYYGAGAATVVARDEPMWQAWMNAHFPMTKESNPCQ
ncbi:MAG: SRPBCC domain-containing protein [Gemmataceae bacterium]|nr:SRPBCC domain-containing protein [Gemmataceae bacterium]MCI0738275.1 SRPBCC domain-containing protein [Gemmataceae bacterium]